MVLNNDKVNEQGREYKQRCRFEALDYYSRGKLCCNCCGEKTYPFLVIDHVNNDGAEHRREIGSQIYQWLKKNNYPEGFQVLCVNCNHGKRVNNGVCPHQTNNIFPDNKIKERCRNKLGKQERNIRELSEWLSFIHKHNIKHTKALELLKSHGINISDRTLYRYRLDYLNNSIT